MADFELNLPGLNELMKSSEMQAVLKDAGRSVVSAAGKDYATQTYVLNYVAVQNVWPDTREAALDNYRHDTLAIAAGSAGLKFQ